ncbi:MAG: hypothetical protein WBP59_11945 [Ilumatobacteraceae bacterium]
MPNTPRERRSAAVLTTVAVLAGVVLGACGSEAPVVTEADHLADLQAICRETTTRLDALPEPPEQISVTDFATSAADLLESEAEQARRLDPPDSLADDHRAFIRNTDEQAVAWRTIADGGEASTDLVDLTTQVGQLVFGRDDLVVEMDAPDCVRGAS